MSTDTNYVSAKTRYEFLKRYRNSAETRFKRCAKVTLPLLYTPDTGTSPGASTKSVRTPRNDTGPRVVNILAQEIATALFPPNTPNFRLSPDATTIRQLADQVGLKPEDIEAALAEVVKAVTTDIETSGVRTSLTQAAKHALVCGNFCMYVPDEGPPKMYPLTRYVANRDGLSTVTEIVTIDWVSPVMLNDAVKAAVGLDKGSTQQDDSDKEIALYTRIVRDEEAGKWNVQQEINSNPVPDTDATYDINACPWIPVRASIEDGEDYASSMVFDHIGGFESVEALRTAILKGAAAAAKMLWFLKQNSSMRVKDIAKAASGDILRGNAADLEARSTEKLNDLQFARQEADYISTKLALTFGDHTAVQRQAERVTAEEIAYMAEQLDKSLGGLYALLSESFILPLVRRKISQLTKNGTLPELPPDLLKPRITVGTDALARHQDTQRIVQWAMAAQKSVGPEAFAAEVNASALIKQIGIASDVDVRSLMLTDEEKKQAQTQQAMMQGAMKAAPEIAKHVLPGGNPNG